MISNIVQVVASVVGLAVVNIWLGVAVLAAVIPSMVVQLKISRMRSEHRKSNVALRRVMYNLEYTMTQPENMSEIRVLGLLNHFIAWYRKLRDKDEREQIVFERKFVGWRLLSDVIEAVVQVGSIIYIVFEIIAHRQPIGQFVYVQQLVSRAMGGAGNLVTQISSMDEDLATLFDYEEFMALPEGVTGEIGVMDPPREVEFRNVSFTYPHSKAQVLDGVSLTIEHGQHVAIVGENGAGKTTLIKLLLGLYNPNNGTVLIDGNDMTRIDKATWHHHIGLLEQKFVMYYFTTARENVEFGDLSRKHDEARFQQALKRAEAKKFVDKLPKGADTLLGKWMVHEDESSGVEPSGGQWQRLALARNFYRDAPFIILDEPTSAIDALAEARIFKHLFNEKRKTVVTISHRLNTVKRADVIYMMENGKIIERGTHAELVKKRGAYFRLFEEQLT